MSPDPLKSLFQWSDDEGGEASGNASSATVNSVQTGRVSANLTDNNNDDLRQWMEAQEQTSRAQKEALDFQQMLTQLLTNQNNNDTESNHYEEEHNEDEWPKTEKSR